MAFTDFARDSFTLGSEFQAISSRSPELGGGWVRDLIGSSGAVYLGGNPPNRAYLNTGNPNSGAVYAINAVADSPDYRVGMEMLFSSTTMGGLMNVGVIGRIPDVAPEFGYWAGYDVPTGKISLGKFGSGVVELLGAGVVVGTPPSNTVYVVELDMVGDQLSLIIDGVVIETVADGTYTGIGKCGIAGYAGATNVAVAAVRWREFYAQQEAAAPVAATELRFTAEPATTQVGSTLDPVEVSATDAAGEVDATATGNVTVDLLTAPAWVADGALTGTLTRPLVAGVATFDDLVISAIGTGYSIQAAHDGVLTTDESAAFDITAPGGSGATVILPTRREMQPMNSAASVKGRTLVFDLLNADGTAATGVTGKAQLSTNGAAAVASTNDIAAHPVPGRYTLELAAAELAAVGDYVAVVPFGGADLVGGGEAVVVGFDPNAAPPAVSDIAAGILADPANLLLTDASGYVTSTNAGTGLTPQQQADLSSAASDAALAASAAAGAELAAESVDAKLSGPRATLLDNLVNLDAAISSISGGSGGSLTAAQDAALTDLHERLTAARALLLDNLVNLDAAVSTAGDPVANADAVRAELAAELALISTNLDVPVSSVEGGGGGGGLTVEQEAKLDAILREAAQAFTLGARVGSVVTMTVLDSDGATIGTRTITFAGDNSPVLQSVGPLVEGA